MDTGTQKELAEQLRLLNTKLEAQNSLGHILLFGILYGIGFVVGSAILATILIGILSQLFGNVPWIVHLFQAGAAVIPR